jgi:hypothetical protein
MQELVAAVVIEPMDIPAEAYKKGFPGLKLHWLCFLQALADQTPNTFDGVQVRRMFREFLHHWTASLAESSQIPILPQALLMVPDEVHGLVVTKASLPPRGELRPNQPLIPVAIHVGGLHVFLGVVVQRQDIVLQAAVAQEAPDFHRLALALGIK